MVAGLCFWRHLLVGSPYKVTVWTDHANLQYYHHPQKVNRRVAQYIAVLGDYNLKLKHLPGIKTTQMASPDDQTMTKEEKTMMQ